MQRRAARVQRRRGKESGKDDGKEEEEESVKVEALVRQESDGVGEGTQQE